LGFSFEKSRWFEAEKRQRKKRRFSRGKYSMFFACCQETERTRRKGRKATKKIKKGKKRHKITLAIVKKVWYTEKRT